MRKLSLLWGLLLSVVLLGAGSLWLPPTPLIPKAQARSVVPLAVRQHPEYRRAVQLFAQGKRLQAQQVLRHLQTQEGLSATERLFLERQLALAGPTPSRRADCGPRALALACQRLGLVVRVETLARLAGTQPDGTTLEGLQRAAQAVGLTAQGVQVDREALAHVPLPAIAWMEGEHYVVVLALGEEATLHDPNDQRPKNLPLSDLLTRSRGILLTLRR